VLNCQNLLYIHVCKNSAAETGSGAWCGSRNYFFYFYVCYILFRYRSRKELRLRNRTWIYSLPDAEPVVRNNNINCSGAALWRRHPQRALYTATLILFFQTATFIFTSKLQRLFYLCLAIYSLLFSHHLFLHLLQHLLYMSCLLPGALLILF
jgi:hypothetical protein